MSWLETLRCDILLELQHAETWQQISALLELLFAHVRYILELLS